MKPSGFRVPALFPNGQTTSVADHEESGHVMFCHASEAEEYLWIESVPKSLERFKPTGIWAGFLVYGDGGGAWGGRVGSSLSRVGQAIAGEGGGT
jgi:hypothetical protein